MTVPLWPSVDPCGCPVGEGHHCPPPWVDEWPEPVAADRETRLDQVESGSEMKTAPAGNRGLTHDLRTQEGAST